VGHEPGIDATRAREWPIPAPGPEPQRIGSSWWRRVLGLLAFSLAALPCLVLFFRVWPEMVTAAYLMTKGWPLYQGVIVPETPLLPLLLAGSGRLFGFSTAMLRGLAAVNCGLIGLLAAWGAWRHRGRRSSEVVALLFVMIVVPMLVFFTEANCLWPDAFVAPFLLGGALVLERFERHGRNRELVGAGLLFGTAILVKQTSAWALLAAVLWLALASRRRSWTRPALLLIAGSGPYLLFVVGWALVFGTMDHIRWTLMVPLTGGFARDIQAPLSAGDLPEAAILFLGMVAVALVSRALPASKRLRSPLPWVAVGAVGMAFPRWELLHLSGAIGICAVATARAGGIVWLLTGRRRGGPMHPFRLVSFSAGTALLVTQIAVLVGFSAMLLPDALGGPAWYWDDATTRLRAAQVAERIPPGGHFLNYLATWDTVYILTETTPPTGVWTNPAFWYSLKQEHLGERMLQQLRANPGTWIFYRAPEPDDVQLSRSAFHRGLLATSRPVSRVDDRVSWRQVVAGPATGGSRQASRLRE